MPEACWGRVFYSISFYSGEFATVFNYCRHAFGRSGTLQKAQWSASRYFDDLIQLFWGISEEEKAMPKTEWQTQDSGYSPLAADPRNGDSHFHCSFPLCLLQRRWDGAFFPALWLPALPPRSRYYRVRDPKVLPFSETSGQYCSANNVSKRSWALAGRWLFLPLGTPPASAKVIPESNPCFHNWRQKSCVLQA